MQANLSQFLGVNTQKKPVLNAGVRKVNDGMFTGRVGTFQRYNVSSAASDVLRRVYKGY